jgi:hypothetical protein
VLVVCGEQVDLRNARVGEHGRHRTPPAETADISLGSVGDEPDAIPDSFWIAEYPEELYRQWQSALETGHQYYLSTTLPNVKKLFDRPAQEQ